MCTPLRHEEEQEGEEEEENKIIGKESKMIALPSSMPLPLPLLSFIRFLLFHFMSSISFSELFASFFMFYTNSEE